MNDAQRRNLVMYRPNRPGHVESFFFKVVDPGVRWGLWIKFTILAPTVPGREPLVSVWVTRASAKNPNRSIGVRNTVPLSRCKWNSAQAGMEVGPCAFGAGWTRGRVKDALGNELAWDVTFETQGEPFALYPYEWMYTASLPKFKVVSPYADGRARGFIEQNGNRSAFNNLPCMQGHNWGNAHAETYAWSHCNAFDGRPDAVFEGFSAKVKVGGRDTPFLSSAALRVDGKVYRFNKLGSLLARDVALNRQSWGITLHEGDLELRAIAVAHRQDFAGLMYPNPDFSHRLCMNAPTANLTVELTHRKSGDRIHKLVSTQGAMLEIIMPHDWPDVCLFVPPMDDREIAGTLDEGA